jgi:hypothetical protein
MVALELLIWNGYKIKFRKETNSDGTLPSNFITISTMSQSGEKFDF